MLTEFRNHGHAENNIPSKTTFCGGYKKAEKKRKKKKKKKLPAGIELLHHGYLFDL